MSARVFPQVTQRREILETATFRAVKSIARMQALVSLQTVQSIKSLIASMDRAAEWLFLRVDANMDPQRVRRQKGWPERGDSELAKWKGKWDAWKLGNTFMCDGAHIFTDMNSRHKSL